jgi:hypothetical protein
MGWLIADGLDGMIARATGTASALGRFLDGICDHAVFIGIYVALAASIGTGEGWILACSAGALHALQSNLYESERARFHRRCKGIASVRQASGRNWLLQLYDRVGTVTERFAIRFDDVLRREPDPLKLADAYGASAAKPLRFMSMLSANVRVYAIFLACIAGNPRLFWWFVLFPLTAILIIGLCWHRAVESRIIRSIGSTRTSFPDAPLTHSEDVTN